MRHLGVSAAAWSINIAATGFGLLIWFVGRRLPPPGRRATRALLTAASIATILLPFTSQGMLGVHRWVSVAGLRLHASAIAAPLLILCVAVAASHRIGLALAIGATGGIILALQPDAAQATSLAAACTVVFVHEGMRQRRQVLLGVALLLAVSVASFIRHDPLPPVAHVEGIFTAVASGGPAPAVMATVALLLLPVPFFVAWYRHRRSMALALGVYVAMTLLAPAWGTFPVPVMGYGASPILGYFIALVAGLGGPSRMEEL
jgi:cell division protein FtsW (lipid II flippase)